MEQLTVRQVGHDVVRFLPAFKQAASASAVMQTIQLGRAFAHPAPRMLSELPLALWSALDRLVLGFATSIGVDDRQRAEDTFVIDNAAAFSFWTDTYRRVVPAAFEERVIILVGNQTRRNICSQTDAERRGWAIGGARGDVSAGTRRRYARVLAKFLHFCEQGALVETKKLQKLFDTQAPLLDADADELAQAVFRLLAQPKSLNFGDTALGKFVTCSFLVHGQDRDGQQFLPPDKCKNLIAAMKFNFLVFICSALNHQSRQLVTSDEVVQPALSGFEIEPPSSDTIRRSQLGSRYGNLFVDPAYGYFYLKVIGRACDVAVQSLPLRANVRYLSTAKDAVQMRNSCLSVDTLRQIVKSMMSTLEDALCDLASELRDTATRIEHMLETRSLDDTALSQGIVTAAATASVPELNRLFESFCKSQPQGLVLPNLTDAASMIFWRTFLLRCESIQSIVFTLLMVTGGCPKRGAELSQTRLQHSGPSGWEARTVSLDYSTVMLVDTYTKSSSMTGRGLLTRHFLPRRVAALVLTYAMFIRPLELAAAAVVYASSQQSPPADDMTSAGISSRYGCFLFVSGGRRTKASYLNSAFARLCSPLANSPIGVRSFRQLCIALAEAAGISEKSSGPSRFSVASAASAGHSIGTHLSRYGRSAVDAPLSSIHESYEATSVWHRLLGFPSLLPDGVVRKQHVDCKVPVDRFSMIMDACG